ncbi:hypothetical protein [Bacillus sp. UNC41MFS5]|uniref:hypothetical protein n=1 Tax=Bacillus sp. UNC41MFS5 TaxID=1449046 RepID=UPI00047EE48E|nr:hypothetical protein [Bacillus sp. UNC41MFS5]
MKIYVTMKSLAKRKDFLTKQEIDLEEIPQTLRQLLTGLVTTQVQEFNAKISKAILVRFITNDDIQQLVYTGKVGFGTKYNEQPTVCHHAVMTAIRAYEDGLFRVYMNEQELSDLDGSLEIKEGDQLTFIKLTMLAGRMW